mgnify:CR=1 FL=1
MIYQGDGCRLKVGIPRGLLFYRFYSLWTTYLKELGVDIVISPPTNKLIIQHGLTYGIEEICFPVKVFLGHCYYLKDKVDLLFIPRMVSFSKNEYNCPKILGLPDVCLLYTSDAADDLLCVDLGGRRIIKKKKKKINKK